jgi:hypothetical protein
MQSIHRLGHKMQRFLSGTDPDIWPVMPIKDLFWAQISDNLTPCNFKWVLIKNKKPVKGKQEINPEKSLIVLARGVDVQAA